MSQVRDAADAVVAAAREHDPAPQVVSSARASPRLALALRVSTFLSWIVLVVTAFMYTFVPPSDGNAAHNHTIWGVNHRLHTPFALNSVITSIYVDIFFLFQLYFVSLLCSSDASRSSAAMRISPYITLSNLLFFAQIELWVRMLLWPCLAIVIFNFLLLVFAYLTTPFASSSLPVVAHSGALSMPLSFAFVSLYWVGAAALDAHSLAARIVANVFIWGWAGYAAFFLVAFRDWTVGLSVSVLTAALGVGQFLTHVFALQWIFAFTIMALVFLASVFVASTGPSSDSTPAATAPPEDREREPLLARN